MNTEGNATCPRLIEVALPIREISAESVRDKSLRHGHISTLHLWWARRPLAAARAIVFASVVPDPDDPRCPVEFRQAVERLLKTDIPRILTTLARPSDSTARKLRPEAIQDPDPYRPYDGIEDTLRTRLMAFIAKFSPEYVQFEAGKRALPPKVSEIPPSLLLDDRSLVKWETSDPENPIGREVLRIARELVWAAHGGEPPTVLDPFAGGGSIPLEAARLGCKATANDYNPVAYLILRATCEFPQKYGKPGIRKVVREEFNEHVEKEEEVPNVLAHDVETWAMWILERARERIGHLYPPGKDGRPVVGYLWARTAPCSNPACVDPSGHRSVIPLLRTLYVCNKPTKRVALTMDVDKVAKTVSFGIARANEVERTDGTMLEGGNVRCPFCEQITPVKDLRAAGLAGKLGERMVCVIVENKHGKDYRPVEETDLEAFQKARTIPAERPNEPILPEITGNDDEDISNSTGIRVHLYGMKTWGSLFNHRQLVAMQAFVACLHEALEAMKSEFRDEEYWTAVAVYLGLWVSRNAMRMVSVGRWDTGGEKFQTPFDAQAIPMKWDYAEADPFTDVTGGVWNQLEWITRFILREQDEHSPAHVTVGDAATLDLEDRSIQYAVMDPPYFDSIAYADISDFFYVWLKRALGHVQPHLFATPQTPKVEEAVAHKHRHHGDRERALEHFRNKLTSSFAQATRIVGRDGMTAIMFAHQSTEAWTALVNAILDAGLNITATYPLDTELKNRAVALGTSALESSITVACRPRVAGSKASFRDVRREIERAVREAERRFWGYGFRGADLIVACYGPAVGVFGKYERVEKADGTPVEVPELLELARKAARDAIAGEFSADNVSTVYYVWANLYGVSEQAWDDARLVAQIGGEDESAMEMARQHAVFVVDGPKCRLALLVDRAGRRGLGVDPGAPLVDKLHQAMDLWKREHRTELVAYLREHDLIGRDPFWKLAQALFEVLPHHTEDWQIVRALLGERDTLRTEGRRMAAEEAERKQGVLFGSE